jgi:RNA polymerase subunit RPABC4/transcription elongation factor Spt4
MSEYRAGSYCPDCQRLHSVAWHTDGSLICQECGHVLGAWQGFPLVLDPERVPGTIVAVQQVDIGDRGNGANKW